MAEVASSLGISQQQVQKYEMGRNKVSASRVVDLCTVLGVSIDYFYDAFEQVSGTRQELRSNLLARTESITLIKNYWKIDDAVTRSAVLELLKRARHVACR